MRIRFVCSGTLASYLTKCDGERVDLTVFGFNGMGEVNYEKELKGETRYFEDAALLSKTDKNTVVSGCVTDTRGHKRRSAVVAECGRLLGVSDMLNVIDGEVGSGAALRVYDTKAGKMGIAVDDDLRFPDTVRSLAVCGSDFIVCPYTKADEVHTVLLRSHAYCFGVPILFCADGYAAIAEPSGNIVFATPQSPAVVEFVGRKEYHLVETRQRFIRNG